MHGPSVYARPKCLCTAQVSHYTALVSHYTALVSHYTALVSHYTALVSHYTVLVSVDILPSWGRLLACCDSVSVHVHSSLPLAAMCVSFSIEALYTHV